MYVEILKRSYLIMKRWYLLLFLAIFQSCAVASFETANIKVSKVQSYCGCVILDSKIDLQGKELCLPKHSKLIFLKGGMICNGTIVGSETKIMRLWASPIFRGITIKGSWNVQKCSSSFFFDAKQPNVLKQLFALTSDSVRNTVIIKPGEYKVSATKAFPRCLVVKSNTKVRLDGTITLEANTLNGYNIMRCDGKNINITGKGMIVGDKNQHLGTSGEHGHGIWIGGPGDCCIEGITIKDCWGDCIYVRNPKAELIIERCTLDNGRRQGVSITSASSVLINKCLISNVKGVSPEFAIDIEPNKSDTIFHVSIKNVKIDNCRGGIISVPKAQNSFVGNIDLCNCSISGNYNSPIRIENSRIVRLTNCQVSNSSKSIILKNIKALSIKNVINQGCNNPLIVQDCKHVSGMSN